MLRCLQESPLAILVGETFWRDERALDCWSGCLRVVTQRDYSWADYVTGCTEILRGTCGWRCLRELGTLRVPCKNHLW